MTYATEIKEIELKPFAELYLVESGTRVFRYTSYSQEVIFQGFTYLPTMIKSQVPSIDSNFKANRIDLTVPVVAPFGEYIANLPIEPIFVTKTRVFLHDLTAFKVMFRGKALGITFVDNGDLGLALVNLESNSIYFRNKVPTMTFKSYCNNTLYFPSDDDEPNCNLLMVAFEVSAVITIDGSTLESTAFGAFVDGYFIGGHVKTAYGDYRFISNHIGDIITINVPFDSRLQNGATVMTYPGCDKSPQTCIDKFNNYAQFRGFPFIPSNNPTHFGADR